MPPSERGYAFSIWTAARLCVHAEVQYGALIYASAMYILLKGLGFRHNRRQHSAKPGLDRWARGKMSAVTKAPSSPVASNHILHEDESGAHMLPTLGSTWRLCGK